MADQQQGGQQGDDQQAYEQALQRPTEDLAGDMEENRNLTGSTTYQTLPEQEGDEGPTRQDGGRQEDRQ